MPANIYRLSSAGILLLFIVLTELICAVLPTIVPFEHSEHALRLGLALFSPIGASVGVLIGFLLNQAHANINQITSAIATEAGQINNLDRLLLRFGDSLSLEIRARLNGYLESIIQDEWTELKAERGSDKTHMKWRIISQQLFKLDPKTPKQIAIYSDILVLSEHIAESRESRIDRSSQKLPKIFWVAIFLLLVAICSINFLVAATDEMRFGVAIFPSVFGAMLGLLVIFDQPFKGSNAIKSTSLEKVFDSISSRTE
jgi:ABC-type multidrug transport system fused ATPase/permease subunit